jgi:hypothetical protein
MPAYNFKPQFVDDVESGVKLNTIRPRRKKPPTKVGDTLFLYTGMRTNNCRRLRKAICTDIKGAVIWEGGVNIGGLDLNTEQIEALAKSDGFANSADFFAFFRKTYKMTKENPLTDMEFIAWEPKGGEFIEEAQSKGFRGIVQWPTGRWEFVRSFLPCGAYRCGCTFESSFAKEFVLEAVAQGTTFPELREDAPEDAKNSIEKLSEASPELAARIREANRIKTFDEALQHIEQLKEVNAQMRQDWREIVEDSGKALNHHQRTISRAVGIWARYAQGRDAFSAVTLDCDLSHSALFGRLLSGKEPLPTPPPTSHSYPWYSLIDEGKGQCELWIDEEMGVVINQNPTWKIEEKVSEDEYVVSYKEALRCRVVKVRPDAIFAWDIEVLPNERHD